MTYDVEDHDIELCLEDILHDVVVCNVQDRKGNATVVWSLV